MTDRNPLGIMSSDGTDSHPLSDNGSTAQPSFASQVCSCENEACPSCWIVAIIGALGVLVGFGALILAVVAGLSAVAISGISGPTSFDGNFFGFFSIVAFPVGFGIEVAVVVYGFLGFTLVNCFYLASRETGTHQIKWNDGCTKYCRLQGCCGSPKMCCVPSWFGIGIALVWLFVVPYIITLPLLLGVSAAFQRPTEAWYGTFSVLVLLGVGAVFVGLQFSCFWYVLSLPGFMKEGETPLLCAACGENGLCRDQESCLKKFWCVLGFSFVPVLCCFVPCILASIVGKEEFDRQARGREMEFEESIDIPQEVQDQKDELSASEEGDEEILEIVEYYVEEIDQSVSSEG